MSVTLLQPPLAEVIGRAAGTSATRTSLLARWHLLSLDAPTVAALWTWFIAASCGVKLRAASIAAMFLAVWALYIADRLLDVRALRSVMPDEEQSHRFDSPGPFEERHWFHARHRTAFLRVGLAVAVSLSCTVVLIPPAALRLYAMLGSLLAVYFLCIHALDAGRRLAKEFAVGAFFSAAVFIPTIARQPELRIHLVPPALLFGALCSVNCLRIYAWEHTSPAEVTSGPEAAQTHSPLTPRGGPDLHLLTRLALQHLGLFHVALLTLAIALMYVSGSPIAAAIALGSAALLAVHALRHRLGRVDLRAAADLALLAPLPVALILRWVR